METDKNKTSTDNDSALPEMSTMLDCIAAITKRGFKDPFNCLEPGLVTSEDKTNYRAHQIKVLSFYRFEGMSDPQDSSILYAIETNDGKKGYLINGYGIYADQNVSRFIQEVEEMSKHIGNKQPKFLKRIGNWFKR